MPRFTETERKAIEETLLEQGEILFSSLGLKKVTVDDLARSANISKGSFYAFYQSKEHLFMIINFSIQERIFAAMKHELDQHTHLETKELAMYIFKWLFEKIKEYPLLYNIDSETIQHVQRRLPKELFDAHTLDDVKMLKTLEDYGISFKQDAVVMAKVFQAIFTCTTIFMNDPDGNQVLTILLEGVLNQLI
ncbi:TetR family transcriptional regulator [Enterococcus florum]|uniref:TetR family transcriptional regulator n=1 Tax=Enterococcus florum TaxID=2480627 RepID=A0A4P5P337_9ENTE|nr:TetR/AcrR family transcriptional regulator [Enterococcus florum]GCF92125.1 TetR family transcriptional regulator [Enterococcus florum]